MQFERIGAGNAWSVAAPFLHSLFGQILNFEFVQRRSSLCERINAEPRLLRCGGATRLLVAIPERSKSSVILQEFQKQLEHVPCVIPATAGEFVTCYEVEQVPLNNVTMNLLENKPNSFEIASRLHTRTDVSWTPLDTMR